MNDTTNLTLLALWTFVRWRYQSFAASLAQRSSFWLSLSLVQNMKASSPTHCRSTFWKLCATVFHNLANKRTRRQLENQYRAHSMGGGNHIWMHQHSESANSAKALHCRLLVSEHMSYKMPYLLIWCSVDPWWVTIYRKKCLLPNVKESEKLILDPHLDPDQHQKLTFSRGSALAHGYQAWSTSVNVFVSYPAQRHTEWLTERTIT